jgi:hypothetical protein
MKTKRTTAEWEQVCDKWQQSGLSQREFCRNDGVNISSFNKWLNRKKFGGGVPTTGICTNKLKFLHISNTVSKSNLISERSFLEISLPNGANLKVGLSQNILSVFLQELLRWK